MPACLLRCFRRVWLSATPWTGAPLGSFIHGTFQARIWEWVAMPSLPDPRIEPCLLHCRWILYCWATGEVQNYHRIQQSHFRVFLQKNWNQEKLFHSHVYCSISHNSQETETSGDEKKFWYVLILEYYSSSKMKFWYMVQQDSCMYKTIIIVMLSEISQLHKNKYCVSPLTSS